MKSPNTKPIFARDIPTSTVKTNYPEPFAQKVAGRSKRALGDHFGLNNWGINQTTLAPGAHSALLHVHSHADELVYVLEGALTLITDDEADTAVLTAGMCVGFPAAGKPHHLVNKSDKPATYLEIGDRHPQDRGAYPNDDLVAVKQEAGWHFTNKTGDPY